MAHRIIDVKPGMIRYRGYAIEELIGRVTFPPMTWLMTRGELPSPPQASSQANSRASRDRSKRCSSSTRVTTARAPLARGLFCLSRLVVLLAHAWEQSQQVGRNKGPIPSQYIGAYDGPPPRPVRQA